MFPLELLLSEEVGPPALLPQGPPPLAEQPRHQAGRQAGEAAVHLGPLLGGEDDEGVHRPFDPLPGGHWLAGF